MEIVKQKIDKIKIEKTYSLIKSRALASVLLFLCLFVFLSFITFIGRAQAAKSKQKDYTIMKPDKETLSKWLKDYQRAPDAYIDKDSDSYDLPETIDLSSYLEYTASERNQGYCGNCWVWAGTGVMEIALSVQNSIKDRLSIQYLNSCYTEDDYACCGGNLNKLADFYRDRQKAFSWLNENAEYSDSRRYCSYGLAGTACSLIADTSKYFITDIAVYKIPTQNVSQAKAIYNIKNVLNQNKSIYLSFFLPTESSWDSFYDFWGDDGQDIVYNLDSGCGQYEDNGGGAHAVLCIGYDDSDSDNPYWIMLNSWGTATSRSNGIFKINMDMDYGCYTYWEDSQYPSFYWYTLNVGFRENVLTDYAESIETKSAVLKGIINPKGDSTDYYFEYTPSTDYFINYSGEPVYKFQTRVKTAGSGDQDISLSEKIKGLEPGQTYYYRIIAVNDTGTVDGGEKTFTTQSDDKCFIETAAAAGPNILNPIAIVDAAPVKAIFGVFLSIITITACLYFALKGIRQKAIKRSLLSGFIIFLIIMPVLVMAAPSENISGFPKSIKNMSDFSENLFFKIDSDITIRDMDFENIDQQDSKIDLAGIFLSGGLIYSNIYLYGKIGAFQILDDNIDIENDAIDNSEIDWEGAGLSCGLGAAAKIFKIAENIDIITDFKYMYYHIYGDYKIDGQDYGTRWIEIMNTKEYNIEDPDASFDSETKASIHEMQLSLFASMRFKNICPYAGLKYSRFRADISFEGNGVYLSQSYQEKFKKTGDHKQDIGIFAGTDIYIKDAISLNIECRYIDEKALSLGLGFRF